MELLYREMEERFWRRQRSEGNGPAMLVLERSREWTELVVGSQETPNQEQGVSSRSFHERRAESGSSRESLTVWR